MGKKDKKKDIKEKKNANENVKKDENSKAVIKKEEDKKPGKVKRFFKKIGEILRKKWLVDGTKTLILVAIIVLLYIGVNILLEKVVLPTIDCTKGKEYSLSSETKDKLANLDKEVTITLINYGDDVYNDKVSFVEQYTTLNNNIKLERIDDLSSRTDLMTKYSLDTTSKLILVTCGDKEKEVTENDMITADYSTYQEIDTTEEAITNAILDVTTEEKPKVYFMSNHMQYDVYYFYTILNKISNEANEVETIDLFANGGIPEDCDCLIISTLKEDITEQERDSLINYINNGGKLLLMCGPNIMNVNLSNFQAVLDLYGVSISNGVVFEGKSSNMLAGYPDFIIETIQSTSLTKNLNMSMNIGLWDAGEITFDEDKLEDLGVEYEVLAKTSDKSFLRTDLTQNIASRTDKDGEEKSSTVAAIATKKIDDSKTSKLVIFSNELFAMNMPIQLGNYQYYTVELYNNSDMILNSVSYLNEREDIITIRKEKEEISTFTISELEMNIVIIIIFTIPVLIIILGIVVWLRRRRKK